jgi:hypothetical protein
MTWPWRWPGWLSCPFPIRLASGGTQPGDPGLFLNKWSCLN